MHKALLEKLGEDVQSHTEKLSKQESDLFSLLTCCVQAVETHAASKTASADQQKEKGAIAFFPNAQFSRRDCFNSSFFCVCAYVCMRVDVCGLF